MSQDKPWTVARFPAGNWETGGRPDSPDYAECEVWQVLASSREEAKRKAQGIRARAQKKIKAASEVQG